MRKLLLVFVVTLGMIFAGYHMILATAKTNNKSTIELEATTSDYLRVKNIALKESKNEEIVKENEYTSQDEPSEDTTAEDVAETTEEDTTEEETTEEETTPDYEILDGVYKVKNDILIEYLGNKDDKSITKLTIPASIKQIDAYVFSGYQYIKTVKFAEESRLTVICMYAFKNCKALKTITLPNGLEKIGYKAFGGCKSLKKLKIPATVTSGSTILGMTSGVESVEFSAGRTSIPKNFLKSAYSVLNVTMKSGVTTIGSKAFYHCTNLKTIDIPNSITKINSYAFSGCTSLEKFTMPTNIASLGKGSFENCVVLKTLALRKSLVTIGKGAFKGDKELTLKVFANSVGKAYARANKLKWEFASSEIKRQKTNKEIYDKFIGLVNEKDITKYQLKYLKDYVPQGVCIIGKYTVVSMYARGLKYRSILVLYDKKSGEFVKQIILPSRDHVGSITNVKNRLVVSLNNISATDYVAVINYKRLKKAKDKKVISYNYVRKLPGYADVSCYDGTIFWAGRSANINSPLMYGYKVKIKKKKLIFEKKYSYIIPANAQGVVVQKGKNGKRTFLFSTSYGRLPNSTLIKYKTNIKKSSSLGKPRMTKLIPAMSEGICLNKKGALFICFESAAKLYCGNPDNTSEIQIKNICKIKYSSLSKLQSK